MESLMGGMRNTARFRASEGVHERRDQVWGEGKTAWNAAQAALGGQGQVQGVWGVRGTSR